MAEGDRMRRAARRIGLPMIAAVFALAACAPNANFVYKPTPPAADARKLPVKVAVLPFTDGTENFITRGSMFGDGQYNLAKTGFTGTISAMPPEFWGKSFADELAGSGSYQSVRFIYSPSEIRDEAFLVDGTVKKAVFPVLWKSANEILVSFKATRGADGKVVWEKEIGTSWINPKEDYYCGASSQCVTDRLHVHWNRQMSGVFAQARADLLETLASLSEGGTGKGVGAEPGRPAGDSVEQTIDRILKGK